MIDLPGTGEIVAGEDRHVVGLNDGVDVVMLITNPKKRAYWDQESASTLDLVLSARCGAAPQDFAIPIINLGGANESQRSALYDDINRKLRDAYGGSDFRILECDAINPDNVREMLMQPFLEHMASRLPAMDSAALDYAELGLADIAQAVDSFLQRVTEALGNVPESTPSGIVLVQKADELRSEVAISLSEIVSRRFEIARSQHAEDPDFEEAVFTCYEGVRAWLEDGLGKGKEGFIHYALRLLKQNKDSGELAANELNRIRVHLSKEFCALDNHLSGQVDGLFTEVWAVLALAFGRDSTASADEGLAGLERDLFLSGCHSIGEAIVELRALRLDYRTHFHPRLREQLDVLSPQDRDPETQTIRSRIAVEPTLEGAHEMLRLLREFGEQAAWGAQKALLEDLSVPAKVLHASIEQFDDAFIRSELSREHFRLFSHHRSDEIWPGAFAQLDQAHRLVRSCWTALNRAKDVLNEVSRSER